MDPNELIRQVPELLKDGAALAGAVKLTDIIKAILGPATAEVAARFHDEVRLYRYGRQLACLKKAEKMATDAGFTPRAVPIKLLFPLLDGASYEEDESLHTMWAALWANASSPEKWDGIRPAFIDILRSMAPDEAGMLKWVCDQEQKANIFSLAKEYQSITGMVTQADSTQLASCLQRLEAENLIVVRGDGFRSAVEGRYSATVLGVAFVVACCPPEPKS